MSIISYQSNRAKSESGFAKVVALIIVIVVIILLALGYSAYAKSQNMWPFNSSATTSSEAKPSVEISKLGFENDVLAVGVKLHHVNEEGHCVLIVSGKTAGLTIDDSKTERTTDTEFKDCTGWNVGANNLPAGEYNVEVKFIGSNQKLSATKMVTKE